MEMLELLENRRSVRSYSDRPIAKEDLEKILSAAIAAPTGKNRQPLFYVILQDKEKKDRLLSSLHIEPNYYHCSAILFSFERREDHLNELNIGAAIQASMMEAESLGISSCWIHNVVSTLQTEEGKRLLKEILDLDQEYVPLDTLALGYLEGEKPQKKERDRTGDKII